MADKVMGMEKPYMQAKPLPISSVQRKCAHCEEEEKKVQRKEMNNSETIFDHTLESYVGNLNGSGQSLPDEVRNFYEPKFGYDFSNVKVHTDPVAEKSAQSINALAYTSGNNIVFNSGQFSPNTDNGKKLLGHELTHVLQQSNMIQRLSITGGPSLEEEKERDAQGGLSNDKMMVQCKTKNNLIQRIPAIEGLDEGGSKTKLVDNEKEALLNACIKATPDPNECEPATPLSWADFTGTVNARSRFAAETASNVVDFDMPSQLCMRTILGRTSGLVHQFGAKFYPGRSWAKPKAKDATNPAVNGCARHIANCERHFDRQAALRHVNVTWAMSTQPDRVCPASPVARGDKATTKGECTTIVGPDCNDQSKADSVRLLSHEQGHFNISCEFAKKANIALVAGIAFATVRRAVTTKHAQAQRQYDAQTNHGCIAAQQASWDAAIAAGLPRITIP